MKNDQNILTWSRWYAKNTGSYISHNAVGQCIPSGPLWLFNSHVFQMSHRQLVMQVFCDEPWVSKPPWQQASGEFGQVFDWQVMSRVSHVPDRWAGWLLHPDRPPSLGGLGHGSQPLHQSQGGDPRALHLLHQGTLCCYGYGLCRSLFKLLICTMLDLRANQTAGFWIEYSRGSLGRLERSLRKFKTSLRMFW